MGLREVVADVGNAAAFGVMIMGAGLIVNLCQLISLVVLPFSAENFRKINNWLGSAFMKSGSFLLERWGGCEVETYGDEVPNGVNALCLANHSSDMDWAVGISYFSRRGDPFPGAAKAVAKDSLKYIPVYGWLFYFLEYMFVKRNWEKDQVSLAQQAKALCASKDPFWVVLFPEGTRKTEKKLRQSQTYCANNGFPVLKNCLFPRFKAFSLVAENMRGCLDGICDATITFEGKIPTTSMAMTGRCHTKARIHVRWIPMDQVPKGEKQLEEWLKQLWVEKDERLSEIAQKPDAFFRDKKRSKFPEEPVDYTRMYGVIAAFAVLAAVVTSFMYISRTFFRVMVVLNCLFWLGTAAALAFNLPPSKTGEKKKSDGVRKKAQ